MELWELISAVYYSLKLSLGDLPGGSYIKTLLKTVIMGGGYFFVIFLIEKYYGVSTLFYRSKHFFHDVIFWFYYRTGIGYRLLMGPLLYVIGDSLDTFRFELLTELSFFWQVALTLLIGDFLGYWIHRMQHSIPFLWAFHTTHHSQRDLNFASTTRFHPIEQFIQNLLIMVPIMMLGADPKSSVIYFYLIEFNAALQHSRIPWRYGPLYYIVSSPTFHNFHHSMDPAHKDKNFAGFFTFYDFIFGTAVNDTKPPTKFGLADIAPTSFVSTLYTPFLILYRQSWLAKKTQLPSSVPNPPD